MRVNTKSALRVVLEGLIAGGRERWVFGIIVKVTT